MPYCIECGAELVPEGAVSCVACGADAYNPELEARKAEERAAREKERAERQRKEAERRERDEPVADFFGEPIRSRRNSSRGDHLTAEDFFA